MKFWTIAYKNKKKDSYDHYPVYEGLKDGRYYLGGSPSQLCPLLFSTKKAAQIALDRVRQVETDAPDSRSWVENGKFLITRCWLEVS